MISVISKTNQAIHSIDVNCKIDIPENINNDDDERYQIFINEFVAVVMGIIETAHRDSPEDVGDTVENLINGVSEQLLNLYGDNMSETVS